MNYTPLLINLGCSMKTCTICGSLKGLDCFYKNKGMAGGTINQCKDCVKKRVRKNRSEKIEYYRSYDRERGARQDASYLRSYRATYPKKYAAHKAVSKAVKSGVLVPQSCECCGESDRVHAHHDDYARQLDIRWLCTPCHKKWHVENGEGRNG